KDAEVRAQAANVLGVARGSDEDYRVLSRLIDDEEPRVRYFAAQSLGKQTPTRDALDRADYASAEIIRMLRDNADKDAYLRQAGGAALARLNRQAPLATAARDESPAVRLAALLALRRLESKDVASFLNDTDPRLVLEAARAINDVPINEVLPQLA